MIIIFGLLCIITLMSLRVHWHNLDEDYLSKENTLAIKGIFVAFVFLSHIRTYAEFTSRGDLFVISILNYLGQLMVTLFLFYSGYGVYESIKRKGNAYIQAFPSQRIGKTFFDFSIAILLFYILGLIIGKEYPISQVLLSLTGWTSIGNSNWYMFAIFALYITTYLCFKVFSKHNFLALCTMTVCSLIYVYILSQLQPSRFSNTYLCYVVGMWYSYFKVYIDAFFRKYNIVYYVMTGFIILFYLYVYPMKGIRIMFFNGVSIVFCLMITFITMKVSIKSKVLIWLGEHLFWIYILQRIPMILLEYLGVNTSSPYLYLFITLFVTLVISKYMQKYMAQLKNYIWKPRVN